MHRAGRLDADHRVVVAQREGDVQHTSGIGTTQRMKARFATAMPLILCDQQRLVKENLLGLDLTHRVLVNALATVALVPIKPLDPRPIDHLSISLRYTSSARATVLNR